MTKIILLHGIIGSKNIFEFFIKELCSCYQTEAIDLIGFGKAIKPDINYDLNDYLEYLESRINLTGDEKYILVGYSLGALLAKELAIKHPNNIIKVFLIGYPWHQSQQAYLSRSSLDRGYIDGKWWAKLICHTKHFHKWLFFPFVWLFNRKYTRAFLDSYEHTYISASRTIHNTIMKDNKENLRKITRKLILINGSQDTNVDFSYAKQFKQYLINGMGHNFLGHETEIAEIIKSELIRDKNSPCVDPESCSI